MHTAAYKFPKQSVLRPEVPELETSKMKETGVGFAFIKKKNISI